MCRSRFSLEMKGGSAKGGDEVRTTGRSSSTRNFCSREILSCSSRKRECSAGSFREIHRPIVTSALVIHSFPVRSWRSPKAQGAGKMEAPKSRFCNILRITHCDSIFYRQRRALNAINPFLFNILPNSSEKNSFAAKNLTPMFSMGIAQNLKKKGFTFASRKPAQL